MILDHAKSQSFIGVWVMVVVFFEVWSCKFTQGLDELESRALKCTMHIILDQLLIVLKGFFSPSISMTLHCPIIVCLSSFMFSVFLKNIMCIVHFEAQSLSIEHIKYFHVCVSVHYLMSIVGPQGVLCAL